MIFGIDVKVIASLIALFGVLLASALSAGAYFYKVRAEAKKSARKSLYYLLEIRYFILTSLFNPERETELYLEHYCKHFTEKGIKLSKDDFDEGLVDLIQGHFENIVSTIKTKAEVDLVKPYEESLLELAGVNPVLSYSLKGKETLAKLISQANQYSESVPNKIELPEGMEWMNDLVIEISNDMSDKAIEDSISQLEEDIIALAQTCGSKTHKNTKIVLENRPSLNNKDMFIELDSYMGQVIEKMMSAYRNQLPENQAL
ncbi:hypothetical protein Q4503_09375 [Colwellia sp. 6_MG-2023]|uniref:hypothetical protein n=1 Tax=Colwellia sp. 6_MG-2023 TaxID=3062676 RepID=UPI0026E32910|nr:hypothetical protein [Colwellia sp. 6_MG-2023]MDO6487909.1 hypothetical protein [Colwellia sp. 6_MG-2023]